MGFGGNFLRLAVVFMPLLSEASERSRETTRPGGNCGYRSRACRAVLAGRPGMVLRDPLDLVWRRVDCAGAAGRFQGRGAVRCGNRDSADLTIIKIPETSPLTVRYKAVGLLLGSPAGQEAFQFCPIFDASKGYTVDVSKPGAIEVAEPLGKILKVLGARMAAIIRLCLRSIWASSRLTWASFRSNAPECA